MRQHIIRDAREHFGGQFRSIRVRDVFPPTDFCLVPTISLPETSTSLVALLARNDALEEADVFTLDDPIEEADEDEEE